MKKTTALLLLTASLICGCVETYKPKDPEHTGQGIFGKTTDKVEKFDAGAQNQVVSDQKIRASDPVSAPLAAYGPITERASKLAIDSAMGIFNATEGRYPADYDEFMEKIIKANNIRLPVLPYKGKYMYKEDTHELVIVRTEEDAAKSQQ